MEVWIELDDEDDETEQFSIWDSYRRQQAEPDLIERALRIIRERHPDLYQRVADEPPSP